MPRFAVLGLHLESNRFAPPVTRADFDRLCWLAGDAILADAAEAAPSLPAEIPAFLQALRAASDGTEKAGERFQAVPILVAAAEPGGPAETAVLEAAFAEIARRLAAAGPLDGVYLSNHGGMVGVDDPDPDGRLYRLVRDTVGPEVPLVATVDLHANISDAMLAAVDCIVSYRTNPHVDQEAVAKEAAAILIAATRGARLVQAALRLPLTPPSVTLLTGQPGPYADAVAAAGAAIDPAAGLLNAGVVGGFVYSDTPANGIAVLATADGDATAAQALVRRLAASLWDRRGEFHRTLTSIPEAIARIAGDGPSVILSDAGDNPGGGGRGTTTALLSALLEAGSRDVLLGLFVDPALAAEACALGAGATFDAAFLRDGGDAFSHPFVRKARVLAVHDGDVVGRRGIWAGRRLALGPTAALDLGGVTAVVTTARKQCADPVFFEMLGLDVAAARAVVVKSRGHFRAGFDETFGPDRVLEVDTPGLTSPVLANFDFTGLPRPAYPLDPETVWAPPAVADIPLPRVAARRSETTRLAGEEVGKRP